MSPRTQTLRSSTTKRSLQGARVPGSVNPSKSKKTVLSTEEKKTAEESAVGLLTPSNGPGPVQDITKGMSEERIRELLVHLIGPNGNADQLRALQCDTVGNKTPERESRASNASPELPPTPASTKRETISVAGSQNTASGSTRNLSSDDTQEDKSIKASDKLDILSNQTEDRTAECEVWKEYHDCGLLSPELEMSVRNLPPLRYKIKDPEDPGLMLFKDFKNWNVDLEYRYDSLSCTSISTTSVTGRMVPY
ncbi:hypothetical protein PUNSTDRAFT_139612 [Punctularia strigosozonata HHB-11173 SS5]|uniref:Uncharacterized protein n=1 Tax=Punctularia strigosozonata (strain HHB-11173) TaxID=741275 RepID=R7S0P5_PUNST|nr:uncharacterized protein PUNSTDRAFT_139612 [Punctularia strigosozonata HHB-11173 SS5]EIN03372.1 hypothetical protein PUNSTDRAFT_139612 [Punctularia strigosozonata HHB-11173 SS5]